MRLLQVIFLAFTVLVASVQGQGFLDRLRNAFIGNPRPVRQNQPARPVQQQQQFQPQQQQFRQQQPQQQQVQFNQQPQQQQQQQQTFSQPQQNTRQAVRFNSFNQNQAFGQTSTRGNFNNNFNPQQQQQQQQFTRQQSQQQQQQSNGCPALPAENDQERESPLCPNQGANHFYKGRGYIMTFINPASEGCTKFTAKAADNYCKANGGRAVSLDDNDVAEHFLGQAAVHAQRYFWTGGRLNHGCGVLTWPSGKQEGWIKGQRYWSHTGGSRSKGPQPDNRHQTEDGHVNEPEMCLGVLNNFYADGIKWHDVACHHKKPTICEL